jgi:hypothetical protein
MQAIIDKPHVIVLHHPTQLRHLVESGLTHLQYDDDTVLFIEKTERAVVTFKFLMYWYETMSRLRINYQKSENFAFGVDEE